ncbi:MAG: phospho-sugar mutase, partial [Lactobacillus iners]|nr:phospho-sugar mutase [Lactobacillus iners]
TIFDGLQEIWNKYGFAYEVTSALEMPGLGGQEKMKLLMDKLRKDPIKEIMGQHVTKTQDFLLQTETINGQMSKLEGFTQSNVLKYFLEDNTWLALRPSGTEPVVKVYVGVNKDNFSNAKQAAEDYTAAIEHILFK